MKILLFIFISMINIYANIATVTSFEGKANILRDNKTIKVTLGSIIEKKDIIKTFENTKVKLTFKDNTLITIGKNSQLDIYDYLYDPKNTKNVNFKVGFKKGLFRTISGKIGKINPNKFKIKIRNSSIGIRGTNFDIYVSINIIKISVNQGIVYIINKDMSEDIRYSKYIIYNEKTKTYKLNTGKIKETEEFEEYEYEFKEEYLDENKDEEDKNTEDDNEDEIKLKEKVNEEKNDENQVPNNEEPVNEEPVNEEPVIKEPNINDFNIPYETTSIYTDDNLEKEVMDNLEFVDYGYWKENNIRVDTFVQGNLTPDVVIDNYINSTNNTQTYNGALSAIITNPDASKISSSGTIQLTMNFSDESFTGNINIDSGSWKANINSGSLNSSDFSSNDISSNGGSVGGISGDINGNYYGDSAQNVGGNFNLTSTNNGSVKGSFGGVK